MKPTLPLLSILILFFHSGASARNLKEPLPGPLVTTHFTAVLDNSNFYHRPSRPGEAEGTANYTGQLTASDFYEDPSSNYNYATQEIFPQQNGDYDITVTAATMNTAQPELAHDTFIFLYVDDFDPAQPLQNLVRANDDKSGSDYTSILTGITFDASKKYIIVMTSYEQGVTGTAEFDVDGPGSVHLTLPVKWLSVTTVSKHNLIEVLWKTTEEVNADAYEVERATDGVSFSSIGRVASRGEMANDYSYTDSYQLAKELTYFYRIRLTDIDGSVSYSKTVAARLLGQSNDRVVVKNPFGNNIELTIYSDNATAATVELIALDGSKILSRAIRLSPGINTLSLEAGRLSKGSYILNLLKNNGTSLQRLLIKD